MKIKTKHVKKKLEKTRNKKSETWIMNRETREEEKREEQIRNKKPETHNHKTTKHKTWKHEALKTETRQWEELAARKVKHSRENTNHDKNRNVYSTNKIT